MEFCTIAKTETGFLIHAELNPEKMECFKTSFMRQTSFKMYVGTFNSSFDSPPQLKVEYITSVSTEVSVILTIIGLTLFPLSYLLIFGIIKYESHGGDPQKRSVFNRLVSALLFSMGLNAFFVNVSRILRCWIGPMGHQSGIIFALIWRFLIGLSGFLMISILGFKNLGHFKPKLMKKGTNDDFWALTICIIDVLFAIICPMADWFTLPSDAFPIMYYFISGEADFVSAKTRQGALQTVGVIVLLLLIMDMILNFKVTKPNNEELPIQVFSNNLVHNPAIISNLQTIVYMVVIIIGSALKICSKPKGLDVFVMASTLASLCVYLVAPMLIYAFNSSLRKYWYEKMSNYFRSTQVVPNSTGQEFDLTPIQRY